jgi:hypothetical protein
LSYDTWHFKMSWFQITLENSNFLIKELFGSYFAIFYLDNSVTQVELLSSLPICLSFIFLCTLPESISGTVLNKRWWKQTGLPRSWSQGENFPSCTLTVRPAPMFGLWGWFDLGWFWYLFCRCYLSDWGRSFLLPVCHARM